MPSCRALLPVVPFVVALALSTAPAVAAGEPMLQVRTTGASFSGAPLVVELAVWSDGRALLVSRDGTQPPGAEDTGVVDGQAAGAQLGSLKRALNRLRIGNLTGGCGQPMPDFYSDHVVTWRGRGNRVNTIEFGASILGCSERVGQLVTAVDTFVRAVQGNADTLVYNPPAVLMPFVEVD